MGRFDKILQYQRLDIELRKILDEIEGNMFNKKMEQARVEFAAAKNYSIESEKAAESIIKFYNNSIAYYEENFKKVDAFEKKLSELDEENDDERAEVISQLEILRDRMTELEKKLSERKSKAEAVIQAYIDAQERGKKLKNIFQAQKQKFESFKAEKEPAIKELEEKLKILAKDIDAELFEQYKALTNERKYPALVEASTMDNGKNYSCNGCGLSLSQKAKSELADNSFCRCETCRRIIFR